MNENVNEDDDLEAEEALLLDEYTILLANYEMSGARDKYEAEQKEQEFLEEFGNLCREELLDVIREYRKDWERLLADLHNTKMSKEAKEQRIKNIDEKHNRDKQLRIEGNERKRKDEASKSEESLAFGIPDFYAVLQEALIYFDSLNKEAGIIHKDDVKKIRPIVIDLIISQRLSNKNLSLKDLKNLAMKYILSGKVRTAREQIKRYQNPKK